MNVHEDIPPIYYDGRECRHHGSGKLANPFSAISIKGSWWLAGFNDMDMELTHETQTNGRPAPPAQGTGSLAA
ncbi:hypothetical protein [Pseudomonas fontis]|uniref:Uncharacterized protein n=1 Tax=Pseudomonas fontis TaxID=2942633 RepID=A0ABT5P011_9PSED|nr:hypothetical protein [Pseudomonas fontis]MDD0977099.1 hypothetical protein [Pseudomonas fontis]MDD0993792.1 hypothetical protein [Pseudomonas fontis]